MKAKHAERTGEKFQSQGEGFHFFHDAISRALNSVNTPSDHDIYITGLPTGIDVIDKGSGGLRPGQLMILAGRFGTGKDYFSQIAYHVAAESERIGAGNDPSRRTRGVVGLYSVTQTSEEVATRIISQQTKIPEQKIIQGQITENEFEKLVSISQNMQQVPLFIDATNSITLQRLSARARRLKRQRGLDVIVIDSINSLNSRQEIQTLDIFSNTAKTARELKSLAQELDVAIVAGFEIPPEEEGNEKYQYYLDFLQKTMRERVVDFSAIINRSIESENLNIDIVKARDEPSLLVRNQLTPQQNIQLKIDFDDYMSRKLQEWDHSIKRIDRDLSQFRAISWTS